MRVAQPFLSPTVRRGSIVSSSSTLRINLIRSSPIQSLIAPGAQVPHAWLIPLDPLKDPVSGAESCTGGLPNLKQAQVIICLQEKLGSDKSMLKCETVIRTFRHLRFQIIRKQMAAMLRLAKPKDQAKQATSVGNSEQRTSTQQLRPASRLNLSHNERGLGAHRNASLESKLGPNSHTASESTT